MLLLLNYEAIFIAPRLHDAATAFRISTLVAVRFSF